MKINISFSELREYIKAHYSKELTFTKVSEQEVCVSYTQNLFFHSVNIPLNIKIHDVKADNVSVIYDGRFGIDMIIAGVLSFLRAKVPQINDALISEDGHRIRIEFAKLPTTAQLVEAISFQRIIVVDDGLEITASLK
ncbi:MAG: hypothetical protein HDR46_04240 [Bacteroides sp.]|nr:hypothetical protein [Bacteroides sp.]MBD5415480.1 hypothetical protein [Bacteroides sp.]